MKLIKFLDQEGQNLISDATNLTILRELVTAEYSPSELAQKLNLPTLNIWRHMQKLEKAHLIELTATQKVGNLEKKRYRSTATYFAPNQYFNFTPKDPSLTDAFAIYSHIQSKMIAKAAAYGDVPKNADPIDFSFFVNMLVFADVCGEPDVQAKIVELKRKLEKFNQKESVSF